MIKARWSVPVHCTLCLRRCNACRKPASDKDIRLRHCSHCQVFYPDSPKMRVTREYGQFVPWLFLLARWVKARDLLPTDECIYKVYEP